MLGLDHYEPLIYLVVVVASDKLHIVCAIYCYSHVLRIRFHSIVLNLSGCSSFGDSVLPRACHSFLSSLSGYQSRLDR